MNTPKIGKTKITNSLFEHFRNGQVQWSTASDLSRRFGGHRDYVKKVADSMVQAGVAIARNGQKGREYRSTQKPNDAA